MNLVAICPLLTVLSSSACAQQVGAVDMTQEAEPLTFHAAPRPLPDKARSEEWPGFLGPRRDARSRETGLDHEFGPEGPPLVWERIRGEGYSAPAVAAGRLVFTHREGDRVHVDCLEPESGKLLWRHTRPIDYRGRYIRNGGPRATPEIDGELVFVQGVDNTLVAHRMQDGEVEWSRDLRAELEVPDDFFGAVASPLVYGDLLIQNVGKPGGPSIVALDKRTGERRWGAEKEWGASCASPVLLTIAGREQLCVMAGGDSRPPTGGLLVLDPKSGTERYRYPFRSRTYESVLGASPVAVGGGVLVTAGYNTGTALVAPDEEGVWREVWKVRDLGCEFTNPIADGARIHLVDGVNGRVGAIVCLDVATGDELARTSLTWTEQLNIAGTEIERRQSIGQASLLAVDGSLLVLGDFGHLLWVDSGPEGAEVRARAKLFFARETWTPPVVHRGLLYVCQNNPDQETGAPARLLCYDLRAGK